MKNANLLVLCSLIFLVTACASKQKILDTSAVSMNHNNLPKGTKLAQLGPVRGVFCMDSFNDKGEFGLMDEAVKDANTKMGAELITSATFYVEGNCVSVEGDGHKVVKD